MTIHTTLHKLPVSLSQSQWSSIVDTRSVPSLLVPSPSDGVLYAEAGWPAYLLKIQTSCYSENRCQSVLWQRIIPITGKSFPPGGSHFRLWRQWPGSHSRRGVIHASDTVARYAKPDGSLTMVIVLTGAHRRLHLSAACKRSCASSMTCTVGGTGGWNARETKGSTSAASWKWSYFLSAYLLQSLSL